MTEYQAVEYPSTQEIMAQIDADMARLGEVLEELRGMMG